jgi:hypothetical protein
MKNFESTYALLVRSEEKSRSLLETVAYAILILSAVFSIWQFAHQSVAFPIDKVATAPNCVIDAHRS